MPELAGDAGRIYPQGNYRELARHLYEILVDERVGHAMSVRSRERAEEVFDNKKNSMKIYEIFKKVIEDHQKKRKRCPQEYLVPSYNSKDFRKILMTYRLRPPFLQYLAAAFNRIGVAAEMRHTDENHWFDRYVIRTINKQLHNFRILPKNKSVLSDHPLTHKNYRSQKLIETYRKFSPDMVLLIRGKSYTEDVLKEIKAHSLLFGWWVDAEERVEEIFQEIHLFDWYFFISPACVELGKQRGIANISLLRHAVDLEEFHPIDNIQKEFDICFVGGWSPKRQKVIESLSAVTDNIIIYGPNWKKRLALDAKILKFVRGKFITGKELVELYNKSRIALNISRWGFGDDGSKRSGMNMRILEVLATGAFLLTDSSEDMETIITPSKHLIIYKNSEECVAQAKYYLQNTTEREAITEEGCRHVRSNSNYTYNHMVKHILEVANSLGNK
jgi:glycosyltransferase involved in cell wall biosynthesis